MIEVNDNWIIDKKRIRNKMLNRNHRQSIMAQSAFLNIELDRTNFETSITNRVDIRLANGNPMSLYLSQYELLDVCNGAAVFELTQSLFEYIARLEYPRWFEERRLVADDARDE